MNEPGLYFSGLALSFDWDRQGERFADVGLDEAIADFMSSNPLVAWSHQKAVAEAGQPYVTLGAITEMRRVPEGIRVVGYVPRPESAGFLRDVYSQLKAGIMRGLSVGGKWLRTTTGVLGRLVLDEVSLASKPVNPRTVIDRVWPAVEAPVLAPAMAGSIGSEGKAAAGTVDQPCSEHHPLRGVRRRRALPAPRAGELQPEAPASRARRAGSRASAPSRPHRTVTGHGRHPRQDDFPAST